MYARGISNREIYNQMQELYGVKISPDMVTAITDKIRASTAEEGYENLIELREKWIKRNINLDNWINNLDNVSTFFKYGPELRKIIYTTNSIESLNNSYKRINKGIPTFPSIQSLEKSVYLATEIITEKWTQPYHNFGVIIN